MAEHDEGGSGSWGDNGSVIFIFIVIVFVIFSWVVSGGPTRVNTKNLFFPQSASSTSPWAVIGIPSVNMGDSDTSSYGREDATIATQDLGVIREQLDNLKGLPTSPYAGKIIIQTTGGVAGTDVTQEYLFIKARETNLERVVISGWSIQSAVNKRNAIIGTGVDRYTGADNTNEPIVLEPGDEAIITSGRSPVGVSFRTNECTGYLEQFQEFTPNLPYDCPFPETEARNTSAYTDNACLDFLQGLGRCHVELEPPSDLSSQCLQVIQTTLTYSGCVAKHQNDTNFRGRQWRVYLGYTEKLWRTEREVLTLLDSNGKLVDSTSY